ncbi:MAG TPA: ABC transporter permease, partial [Burkholderiaceae bacterium]|nr:ABC transporter permease [Burkholderiaceae bacterium]
MSAVLPAPATGPRSEGVWAAAWRRFRGDRVGMTSLVIVAGFVLMMALAAIGLVAGDWQGEVGLPNAPPSFMGPAPKEASVG